MKNNCIYFVEGKCEAALLAALKERPQKIVSGRVKIFNVIEKLIPRSQLVTIQVGTTIVFVFDTDVPITESLKKNIHNSQQEKVILKIIRKDYLFAKLVKKLNILTATPKQVILLNPR